VPQKEGRWEAVIICDDILTVLIEVKALRRQQFGIMRLLHEARDQVLSHLAKHVFTGFAFAKYGVPCHATGVIANMAAVQVFHLRYENVGTPIASLKLYQSSLLPLMSLATFKRWAVGNKEQITEVESLKQILFGSDGLGGMDDNSIPRGIRILLNLMNQPSKTLHGLSVDAVNCNIGAQLGTGATAVVFRRVQTTGGVEEELNSVIKVSRYGISTGIANELKILRALEGTTNEHIPTVIRSVDLEVRFGSVLTKLPAIETAPAGRNVVSFLLSSSSCTAKDECLRLVLDGITAALKYMHSLKIYHCDVTPKNIAIATTSDSTAAAESSGPRAVLIDYSISVSPTLKKLKGFWGTPNYVHRGIFLSTLCRTGWTPTAAHDFAGLGFTTAFLANGCVHTWSVGKYPRTNGDPKRLEADKADLVAVMNERLKKAVSAVKAVSIADDRKRSIKELLLFDENTNESP
jgi:Protein kinase domain